MVLPEKLFFGDHVWGFSTVPRLLLDRLTRALLLADRVLPTTRNIFRSSLGSLGLGLGSLQEALLVGIQRDVLRMQQDLRKLLGHTGSFHILGNLILLDSSLG